MEAEAHPWNILAAEDKTHTVKMQERNAQIMRLVRQVEFIKVYQRLVEDASKDSRTRREFDATKMWTWKGFGWALVCIDWLLVKKQGLAIENGRLKHADKNGSEDGYRCPGWSLSTEPVEE